MMAAVAVTVSFVCVKMYFVSRFVTLVGNGSGCVGSLNVYISHETSKFQGFGEIWPKEEERAQKFLHL